MSKQTADNRSTADDDRLLRADCGQKNINHFSVITDMNMRGGVRCTPGDEGAQRFSTDKVRAQLPVVTFAVELVATCPANETLRTNRRNSKSIVKSYTLE